MNNSENKLNRQDIKKRLFDILLYFKEICEEYGIPYSLAYGTLLGAVRHGGFIPWDDDIDVCLFRDDYERLMEILRNKKSDRFKLLEFKTNATYFYNFSKLVDNETALTEVGSKPINGYGLYIDIFPVDKCSDDKKRFSKDIKKIRQVSRLKSAAVCRGWNPSISKIKNLFRIALAPIAKCFGYKHWLYKEEKLLLKYKDTDSDRYVIFTEFPSYREAMKKSELNMTRQVFFENESFPCFENAEGYLTNRYGDYMQLPPVDKQVSHHNYVVLLK